MPETTAFSVGALVRFNHERDGGPVHRVIGVDARGMIDLHDMGGWLAPHLFTVADDIGGMPPSAGLAPTELVTIEGNDIVIRITSGSLTHATEHGVLCTFIPQTGGFRGAQITDAAKWRDAVVRALRREQENGDTPVHLMLDGALEYALEQGEEGVWVEGITDDPV